MNIKKAQKNHITENKQRLQTIISAIIKEKKKNYTLMSP